MIIERTEDKQFIYDILTHPDLWEANSDETHDMAESSEQVKMDDIIYLKARLEYSSSDVNVLRPNPHLVGLFLFIEKKPRMYEAHANVLPHMRKHSREAGRAAMRWMFTNTDAERLHTMVPVMYPNAFKFAIDMGFKVKKMIPDFVTQQGRLHDAYFMVRYN